MPSQPSTRTPPRPEPLRVNVHRVPATLTALWRWVLWRYELRDGKWTKAPYTVDKKHASVTDPKTWVSFAEACTAYNDGKNGFDGIGFVLTRDDKLTGFDIDHVSADDSFARVFLTAANSYAETSPSGKGLRIIVRGSLLPGTARKRGNREAYDDMRFLTITGHRLDGARGDVCGSVPGTYGLHALMFPPEPGDDARHDAVPPQDAPVSPVTEWTAESLLATATAARNGADITNLMAGSLGAHASPSEATGALLCALAWYTHDIDLLETVARQSLLVSDKWDTNRRGRSFIRYEIESAIAKVAVGYSGPSAGEIRHGGNASSSNGVVKHSMSRMSNIVPKKVSWLWRGRIPYGKITILDGDPGIGKTFVDLDLVSRVTTGRAMPGDPVHDTREPRGAVILMPEDDNDDTLAPRLIAMGADMSRIMSISNTFDVSSPDGVQWVIDAIEAVGDCGLVVFDPLLTYLGAASSDTYKDRDVRRSLDPLIELAIRRHIAIIGNRHLTKNVKDAGSALYRGMGSIGIIAVARVGLIVARNPEANDDIGNVLAVSKNNLMRKPPSLTWHIEPDADDEDVARVVWDGTSTVSADSLVVGVTDKPRSNSMQSEVEDAIKLYIATHGGSADGGEMTLDLAARYGWSERVITKWRGRMTGLDVDRDAENRTRWRYSLGARNRAAEVPEPDEPEPPDTLPL